MPASSRKTIVIGLTGGIATGKSTVVEWLKELAIPVHDADACVHQMFQNNQNVIESVRVLWPDCVGEAGVNRACLRGKVLKNPAAIKQLEAITHPVVRESTGAFIKEHQALGSEIIFLDIPLLFEGGTEKDYDGTLVVYCSPENQRQRALDRGADPTLFDYLLDQQMPLSQKREQADFTLNTDGTLAETREKLIEVLQEISTRFKCARLF